MIPGWQRRSRGSTDARSQPLEVDGGRGRKSASEEGLAVVNGQNLAVGPVWLSRIVPNSQAALGGRISVHHLGNLY